jgi:hypothetical protein
MKKDKAPSLAGERFCRLSVIDRAPSDRKGNAAWHCVCDCGAKRTVLAQSLKSGATQSCGCLSKEILSSMATHGRSKDRDYKAWHGMVQRCTNPSHHKWPRYGGRGISICAEWMSFKGFIAGMGERPKGLTIDRINNDGNYEPENCRWATQKTQGSNRGNNRRFTIDGADMTLSDAARRYGISLSAVRGRLSRGWLPALAFKTPTNQPHGATHGTAI